jgi:hypothetical protein
MAITHKAMNAEPTTQFLMSLPGVRPAPHVARNWAQGRDRAELDRMLDVLTDSWWRLLSDGA